MRLKLTGYIKGKSQALTLSHTHNKQGNITAKQFYLFDAVIPVSENNLIELPEDSNLVLFAASAANEEYSFTPADEHFDRLDKREFDYTFSDYALKRMKPSAAELVLDKLINRRTVVKAKAPNSYNEVSLSELYYFIRKIVDSISYKKKAQKLILSR